MTPCSLANSYQHFGGSCCFHIQGGPRTVRCVEEAAGFVWRGKSGLGDKCCDSTEAASVVGMVVGRKNQKNEE